MFACLFKFVVWPLPILLKFDYRINKSLVAYKVYEKNEAPSQRSGLLQQNQRIKMRLQMENNQSFS